MKRRWMGVVQLLVAAAIVLFAVRTAEEWIRSKPKANRRPAQRDALRVDVVLAEEKSAAVDVRGSGTVRPSRQIDLHPQVQGAVVYVSPSLVPGARVKRGEVLIKIDARDYQIAVREAESRLAKARADVALERGNQEIARAEYKMLGRELSEGDRELVLREPQLRVVEAERAIAQAALDRAKLNQERTQIRAPFDAIIRERRVDTGSRVTENTVLARIAGIDEWWIEVAIPVDQTRWIATPQDGSPGSKAKIYYDAGWPAGAFREAEVIQVDAALEEKGRLAKILLRVRDPLARATASELPVLFVDSWVELSIQGRTLEHIVALSRAWIREGDRVWVMNDRDELEIREVEVAFRGDEDVLIASGIADGERIVTTELSAPVPAMRLRTREGGDESQPETRRGDGGAESHDRRGRAAEDNETEPASSAEAPRTGAQATP